MSVDVGFTSDDVPDQSGKCFLVTGANSGVGFEVTRVLASRGARVLMACRGEAKAQAAMAFIRQETPRADLAFLPLDLGDLASVRRMAEFAAREPRIDVLINNAGVMTAKREVTSQGVELHFGVNHLGCFALTALMLPALSKTPGARVVVTASGLHRRGKAEWSPPETKGMSLYATSKLANVLFAIELDRRLRAAQVPVMSLASHPGFAPSGLGGGNLLHSIVMPFVGLIFNNAAMSAWGTLHAATGRVKSGGYYGPTARNEMRGPSSECTPSALAQDPAVARQLWGLSVKMTGIDPGLAPADEVALRKTAAIN